MDGLINAANVALCALLSILMTWAVLSQRVRDGIVIKVGLAAMGLGFAGLAMHLVGGLDLADRSGIERAILLINLGAGAVLAGAKMRIAARPQAAWRLSEWVDLT